MKNAILATQMKGVTKDCQCGPNCVCVNCQCKPGFKCDDNGCQRLKEPSIETCYVVIDNKKMFTVHDMTPKQAIASIKAQGQSVVFVNSKGVVTTPPAWCPKALVGVPTHAQSPPTYAQSVTPFTMPGITVPGVTQNSTWSNGSYPMGPTHIAAPNVGLYGRTSGSG